MPVIRLQHQPGAYLTNGKRLFEVVAYKPGQVTLEDCKTGGLEDYEAWRVIYPPWRLVQEAPMVPMTPPAKEQAA